MKSPIYESMTKLVLSRNVVRIWRTQPNAAEAYKVQLDLVGRRGEFDKMPLDPPDLARWLLTLRDVSAVEIVDGEGQGCVIYADWP